MSGDKKFLDKKNRLLQREDAIDHKDSLLDQKIHNSHKKNQIKKLQAQVLEKKKELIN